jgi:carbamoylphosphate synthase large subunit
MAKKAKQPVKKSSGFKPYVLSRHPTHDVLRSNLPKNKFRVLIRLGSQNTPDDGKSRLEINTVEAVETSSDKLLMKTAFDRGNVPTAQWTRAARTSTIEFPIVAKNRWGSRGTGNTLIKSATELESWVVGKNLSNYIFEKFHDYVREYRLHVTKDGCFYTCRKMLKEDTPVSDRWYRNDSNSVWIVEENPQFDKPSNWNAIVEASVNALTSVGLDIGAIDVKVQSAKTSKGKDRKEPKFIILETNSAPSFGKITAEKYLETIPKLLLDKKNSK